MAFSLDNLFDDLTPAYSSVGKFFDSIGGEVFGLGKDKETTTQDKPKGIFEDMESDTFDLTNASDSDIYKLYTSLTSSTSKQKRQLRQQKLDQAPQSVSFKESEAMWMNRLRNIATGNIPSLDESK